MRVLNGCTAVLVLWFALAGGIDSLRGDQPGSDPYVAMPWHLVDIWWDLGRDVPLESYSVDVSISDDVSPEVNLYVAPIGLGHLSKTAFYGGIQTQADGYTRREQSLRKIGPGLLMSMWGERSLDAIRPSEGGFCQSSGHEGDFVSVRRPYAWTKGTYTYRVVRMDTQVIAGRPYTWIGAFVHCLETDENVFVGALRFPGENLVLAREIASFVEIYGQRKPVSEIPRLVVTFGKLKLNGEDLAKPAARAEYSRGVPDYAEAIAQDKQVVVTVGQPVHRTQRSVELMSR